MAYYPDLGPIDYFPIPTGASCPLVAVGWLERQHPFTTGSVSREFFGKLVDLCKDPFQPVTSCGFHTSSFQQLGRVSADFRFENEEVTGLYHANLFVPDGTKIFVCPVAILDYIDRYFYKPPGEFITAVMSCPPTKSIEYKKLFLASGGRPLISH